MTREELVNEKKQIGKRITELCFIMSEKKRNKEVKIGECFVQLSQFGLCTASSITANVPVLGAVRAKNAPFFD